MTQRLLLLHLLFLAGCASIGHRAIGADSAPPGGDRTVVLVVVDGLRADVFERYLDTLKTNDFEPDWPSGLSALARERFRLATSQQAEAPMPAFGLPSVAALITGHFPAQAGFPGNAFLARDAGSMLSYDFEAARDASLIYFEPNLQPTPADGMPLASRLLTKPTLFERLNPTHHSTTIYLPFGQGSRWLVPKNARQGTNALLPHRIGAAAAPIFDREVRDAAIETVLGEDVPDLLTLYFRSVTAETCYQADERCDGNVGDLDAIQTRALRTIDAHLARIFLKFKARHPQRFKQATVLLTSTGGAQDRTHRRGAEEQHLLRPHRLFELLAAHAANPTCADWITTAARLGELQVATSVATAQIYLRPLPHGQRQQLTAHLACLAGALEGAVTQGQWLAAATWRPSDPAASPIEPATELQVRINPQVRDHLPAQRRNRLEKKLQMALDEGPNIKRAGDALLIARDAWTFVGRADPRPLPYANRGGLDDRSIRIPFLVASRALSAKATAELRVTPVELMDLAPTILSITGAPKSALAGLPRPPLLKWRAGERPVLDFQHADRELSILSPPKRPTLTWSEGAEAITLTVVEPMSYWPPDKMGLRFGDQVFSFDADQNTFPEGAPCTFVEDEKAKRRQWQCVLPVDRAQPGVAIAAAQRRPAGDEGDDEEERTANFVIPTTWGAGAPHIDGKPQMICATPTEIQVRLSARAENGLAQIYVVVVDSYGSAPLGQLPASAHAVHTLAKLSPSDGCAKDPLNPKACTLQKGPTHFAKTVSIPFPEISLRHVRRISRLFTEHRRDPEQMRARWSAGVGIGATPESAYLAVRICSLSGECTQRPLATDTGYASAVRRGCP